MSGAPERVPAGDGAPDAGAASPGSLAGSLTRQLAAGFVVSAMGLTLTLSLASLVFKGDLASELARGAGWALAGHVVIGSVVALTSSFRGMNAAPQDAPAVVLATVGAALVVGAVEPMATLATFIILSSVFTGVLLLTMGRLRLGALVRYVPFPVVAGFLGGTGLVIVIAGWEMLVGPGTTSEEVWLRAVPGIALAVAMVWLGRRPAVPPVAAAGVVAVAILGYHVAAALLGIGTAEGVSLGLLPGPFPEGSLADPTVITELWSADWGAIVGQLPGIVVMAILVPLGLLLNLGALEQTFETDVDVDRELRATGTGTLLAAPFAGFPGYIIFGETVVGRRLGGVSRVPPLVATGLAAVVLVVGTDILTLLPVSVTAGLLLSIGIDFLVSWVWDVRHRVGLIEHGVIILIIATVALLGFMEGVGLGLVMATIIFVVRYSRIPTVRTVSTLAYRRSSVQRSAAAEEVLAASGDTVTVFELQGFLFFGTAERISQTVRDTLVGSPGVAAVILDFRRVTGLDSSVRAAFDRLARFTTDKDIQVVFCGASADVIAGLRPTFEGGRVGYVADLDHALEQSEERLLDAAPVPAGDGGTAEEWADVPTVELAAGSTIVAEGQRGAGVFYIESGRARVVTDGGDGAGSRLAVVLAGSVIGEISYLSGGGATATVVCDTDCVVRHVSVEWLADLSETDPARALALHRLISRRLADKLTAANRTINSLV